MLETSIFDQDRRLWVFETPILMYSLPYSRLTIQPPEIYKGVWGFLENDAKSKIGSEDKYIYKHLFSNSECFSYYGDFYFTKGVN